MNIYSAQQIRKWDQYTIENEPITSINLMERAAAKCVQWLMQRQLKNRKVYIFCGKGNNGGDGLAIGRLLSAEGIDVVIYILEFGKIGSDDFQLNLQRLHPLPIDLFYIQAEAQFPNIEKNAIVIDALYGSGLNHPLEGLSAALVRHINTAGVAVVSIDVPSGLFMDASSKSNAIIKASYTLTFQCYKLALLIAENAPFIGTVQVLNIGLHPGFAEKEKAQFILVEENMVQSLFKPRNRFAHKGTFGHTLLIGGSFGKTGAILLAAKACLRSGAGLLTACVPASSYHIIQTTVPEAMALADSVDHFITKAPQDLEKYSAIGIGPGLGTEAQTQQVISEIFRQYKKPMVLDADALNLLALDQTLLHKVPPYSILTPHPKEFERLFGKCDNDFERLEKALQKAKELGIIIILKGHHTLIALPGGAAYFNSTGNAGMAKGGSGDVLTGIITALLAQGYTPENAAIIGVYLHGMAGDAAAKALSMEAMLATDLIQFLPQTFLHFNQQHSGLL